MIQNKLSTNLKLFILPLIVVAGLHAATYDENYDVNATTQIANYNVFMDGNFKEIIRFKRISFADGNIEEDSKKILDKAIDKAKKLIDAGENIKITIIGHTQRATDDANELTIDSDTYANDIQNWFRDSLDTNENKQLSNDYATFILEKMEDNKINKNLLFVESRGGVDPMFTDESSNSSKMSNLVLVSIYVEKTLDIDSDKDGVLDFKDKCEATPSGVTVDPNGCALKMNLHLNFQTNSDKILAESSPKIKQFVDFLKKNTAYDAEIIGHTDSIGKAGLNMKLSQRRAASIKSALVAEGVDASRLTTRGRGELDPIESNRTEEGRSANRRIEVKLKLNK